MIDLKLGILYKSGKIVNHRSLLKVLINPILRYFRVCIATTFNDDKLGNICFIKCDKIKPFIWNCNNHNEYDLIIKKRIFI